MQRIEVKNLGPLKDVSLDIKDYMIFIGPQASGKSTLAKLVWFLNDFGEFIVNFYSNNLSDDIFRNLTNLTRIDSEKKGKYYVLENYFAQLKYPKVWFNDYSKIDLFLNKDVKIEIGIKGIISISNSMKKLLEELDELYRSFENNFSKASNSSERLFIAKSLRFEIKTTLAKYSIDYNQNNILVPAARAVYSLARDYRLSYSPNSQLREGALDAFYGLIKDISEEIFQNPSKYFNNSIANTLLKNVLKGGINFEVVNFGGNEKGLATQIESENFSIDLEDASSGQQESIWILLMIVYFLKNQIKPSIIIEEPEAHLFPEAQRDLTYLISLLANQQGNQVLLTTHSPYILASLNNLLKAYTVGQSEQNKEAVGKIIDPLLWVNPERVYVGYMENGEIRPILNPDLQQIEHDLLDNVSNDIMTKFDELLDIQYNQ